jgi:hypothetical protein
LVDDAMSYYAYDVHGYLGDVASGPGWHDFTLWAATQGGALAQLAKNGYVYQTNVLAAEAARATAPNASAASILSNLIQLARKAEDCLLVSDGWEGDGRQAA